MSGFDTGSGSYDKVAHVRGGEGLGIDAQTAGRQSGPGEGVDAGSGEADHVRGHGLSGGPGGQDITAAATGKGEGLDAGDRGSDRPGGGVTLNAGRQEEFNSSNKKNFYDAESHVQQLADKIKNKVTSNKS